MGVMDTLKDLLGQGKKAVADNKDTINSTLDKGVDFAKDKAGEQHHDKIDKAADGIKGAVDKVADDDGQAT
jgi:MT0933-like antitoxin protein